MKLLLFRIHNNIRRMINELFSLDNSLARDLIIQYNLLLTGNDYYSLNSINKIYKKVEKIYYDHIN